MVGKFSFFNMHANRAADDHESYAAHRVFAIESHRTLLNTRPRRQLLSKIKRLSQAPEEYYQALYIPLLEKVSDYFQSLPDVRTYGTNFHTQWLDSALARTAYAMAIRHRITLPENATDAEAQEEYALWTYVVFSSSLLWHMGKLCTHYMVSICDDKGVVTKHWHPMIQSLFMAGSYYKIRNIDKNGSDTFKHTTTLLARNLMPTEGFAWIADNDRAMEYWLIAMIEEGGSEGNLLFVHELARRLFDENPNLEDFSLQLNRLDKQFKEFDKELRDISQIEKALRDNQELPPVKISEPPETQLGEEFMNWLRRGIANHSIAVNSRGANVHISKEGVILAYPGIFQDFCSMFHKTRDWIVVYKQFNYLGLHKQSGSDTVFGKFFIDPQREGSLAQTKKAQTPIEQAQAKMLKGVIIKQPRSVFGHNNLPAANPELGQESGPAQEPAYPKLHGKPKMGIGDKK